MVLIWISTRAVIVYKHNLYHRIKLCFVIPLRPNGKIQGWNFQDGWTLRVSGLTKFECDARWRFRESNVVNLGRVSDSNLKPPIQTVEVYFGFYLA